jgi:transcriptional regulator with XRE-family HTH domain
MPEKDLAKRIRQLRLPGETQIEFASRLELTQASVSRYLSGSKPNREAVMKIAKRTGASMDWLLTGKGAAAAGALAKPAGARVTKPMREDEWLEAALSYLDKLSSLTRSDREALKALLRDVVANPGRLRQVLNHWEPLEPKPSD